MTPSDGQRLREHDGAQRFAVDETLVGRPAKNRELAFPNPGPGKESLEILLLLDTATEYSL